MTVRAVANVLPQSALPLRAVAVPFRGHPRAKVHPVAVAIEVTASPRDGQPERAEVRGGRGGGREAAGHPKGDGEKTTAPLGVIA